MRLRVIFVLMAVFVLSAAPLKAQRANALKNLTQVSIVVEDLSDADAKIGLTRTTLESQALVAVKRDMPKVSVNDSAIGYVYVRINTLFSNGEFVANVDVELKRPVTVLTEDGAPIGPSIATVWGKTVVLTGSGSDMASRVLAEVSLKITELAAAYYKANP